MTNTQQPQAPAAAPLSDIHGPLGGTVADFAPKSASATSDGEVTRDGSACPTKILMRAGMLAGLVRHIRPGKPMARDIVDGLTADADHILRELAAMGVWHPGVSDSEAAALGSRRHQWTIAPPEASATSGGQVATIIPYTDEEDRPDPYMAGLVMIAIGRDGTHDHVLDRIPEKEAAIICEAINRSAPQPAGTPDNPCLRKLRPGEPFFVLIGRDLHAARATRHWAEQREAERGPSPKVDGARQIADQMDAYRGDGVSSAPHPALIYPDDLTPALTEALGVPNFKASPIAHALRAAGADIPRKSEAEQAHVLHWFVKLALQHGDGWWKVAGDEIQRIALAARQSSGEGSANG